MPDQRERAGLHDHGDGRQDQRQLVGDQLRGGPQRPDQARTCSRWPSPPSGRRSRDTERWPARRRCRRRGSTAHRSCRRSGMTTKIDDVRDQGDGRGEREHHRVGGPRDHVLLLDELHAVGDQLGPPVEHARLPSARAGPACGPGPCAPCSPPPAARSGRNPCTTTLHHQGHPEVREPVVRSCGPRHGLGAEAGRSVLLTSSPSTAPGHGLASRLISANSFRSG